MIPTFIVLTLVLSAMFSGMEIAFISANKLNIELKKSKGTKRGLILAKFFDEPADFLSTMLVGNNITLVIFASLMAKVLEPRIEPLLIGSSFEGVFFPLLLVTLATTGVVLIFGEFLPKIFFRLFADRVLFFMVYPLQFIKFILRPISMVMVNLSDRVLRLFVNSPPETKEQAFTRLDLEQFVLSTQTGEEDQSIDTELFGNVLYLKKTKVKDCMVPRTEIKAVDIKDSIDDAKQTFIESSISKVLVYNESIDEVLGYIHHQQLWQKPKNLKQILLDIPIVPEVMPALDLMNKFIAEHISIACVVDEFGGTAGIITLEDILEEIFGEIEDEHDREEYIEQQISPREYRFSGRLEIDYLNEKYDFNLPEGEYHTLSGYIVMTKESIPKQGERIYLNGYTYIMEIVSEKKIETVQLFLPEQNTESEN